MIPERVDASIATVARQFDRRAANFGRHDALVREVADRMFERLAFIRHPAQVVLDLGCGQGACRAALERRFPQARWLGIDLSPSMLASGDTARGWARIASRGPLRNWARWLRQRFPGVAADNRICASAEALPLPDSSVDMVFSNLMLHWHPQPHRVVAEIARVLRVGGLVMFSSYGPDTGKELRRACAASLADARPMPFVDMHDFGDMLVSSGFEAPVMEVDHLDLRFGDARQLLAEARGLGGNPRADRARGLPSGRRARALLAALAAGAGADGRLPLHVEVVIGHGWKAPPRAPGVSTIALPLGRVR